MKKRMSADQREIERLRRTVEKQAAEIQELRKACGEWRILTESLTSALNVVTESLTSALNVSTSMGRSLLKEKREEDAKATREWLQRSRDEIRKSTEFLPCDADIASESENLNEESRAELERLAFDPTTPEDIAREALQRLRKIM
jgi:hypothetical protein